VRFPQPLPDKAIHRDHRFVKDVDTRVGPPPLLSSAARPRVSMSPRTTPQSAKCCREHPMQDRSPWRIASTAAGGALSPRSTPTLMSSRTTQCGHWCIRQHRRARSLVGRSSHL